MPNYQRILLKLSGEAMAGQAGFGVDSKRVRGDATPLAEVAPLSAGGDGGLRPLVLPAGHREVVVQDGGFAALALLER